VGTKAKLAVDWKNIESLGQDLVAMNVNDLLCVGAEPLLFLDYYACGELHAAELTAVLKSIQHACELSHCTLVGGETAEMPGVYRKGDFDLAGFSIGVGERRELLGAERVREGDAIVALASSGLHSNGFSLVRKLVEKAGVQPEDPTPFGEGTWKEVLLRPTTIYVPLLKGWNHRIHAAAHLTGGGLFENLPRVIPAGMRARVQAWDFPPLFQWLQSQSELSTQEMLSTFNCGVGMLVICPEEIAPSLIEHARKAGIRSWKAGSMESASHLVNPEVVWE
jgi:phosphoribosylformylglycinamidine cyclo-ligase